MRSLLGAFFSVALLISSLASATQGAPAQPTTPSRVPRKYRVVKKHQPQPIGLLVSGGDMAIWQKTSDGRNYDMIQRWSFRAGYSFHRLFDIYGEYGWYAANSDSGGNLTLHYHHDEYLIWIRKMFLEDNWWGPFVAAGLGAQQEIVTTTFDSSSTRGTGTLQALGALAGGFHFGDWVQIGRVRTHLQVILEGRLSASAGLSPNPEPGIGAQLEVGF